MEILGVGPSELVFIIIIALIILGPKDMQKAGKTLGKWMRDIVTSDGWRIFQQTSREMRNLPTRLIREANEEINQVQRELNNASKFDLEPDSPAPAAPRPNQPPRSQPATAPRPYAPQENKIAPPSRPADTETPAADDRENNA